MSYNILQTLDNFPRFKNFFNIYIHEKSPLLKKKQKIRIKDRKVFWIDDLRNIKKGPCLFLANEFFDALPIKQFFKKKEGWVERFVNFKEEGKAEFKEQPADIKKIEQNLNFTISKEQEIIEYSPGSFEYLKNICNLIKKNDGGILIIDYGYLNSKMYETLQAVNNHKYSNVLENSITNLGSCKKLSTTIDFILSALLAWFMLPSLYKNLLLQL